MVWYRYLYDTCPMIGRQRIRLVRGSHEASSVHCPSDAIFARVMKWFNFIYFSWEILIGSLIVLVPLFSVSYIVYVRERIVVNNRREKERETLPSWTDHPEEETKIIRTTDEEEMIGEIGITTIKDAANPVGGTLCKTLRIGRGGKNVPEVLHHDYHWLGTANKETRGAFVSCHTATLSDLFETLCISHESHYHSINEHWWWIILVQTQLT